MAAVKLTSPGVPDIYQGNELLGLLAGRSRQPPARGLRAPRAASLERAALGRRCPPLGDEHAKLFVIGRLLALRRAEEDAVPATPATPRCAPTAPGRATSSPIARRHEGRIVVCVVPRLLTKLGIGVGELPCGAGVWGDTRLDLPFVARGTELRDVFSDEKRRLEGGVVAVGEVLTRLPVAVLASAPASAHGPRPR